MKIQRKKDIKISEYRAIHGWIGRALGKANFCEFCNKKRKKKYEWALKKGFKYARNKNNFLSLCTSCHIKYDYTKERAEKTSKRMMGHHVSEETIKKIVLKNTGRKVSKKTRKKLSIAATGKPSFRKRAIILEKNGIELHFDSLTEVESKLGILVTSVCNVLKGRASKCGGYTAKYKQ